MAQAPRSPRILAAAADIVGSGFVSFVVGFTGYWMIGLLGRLNWLADEDATITTSQYGFAGLMAFFGILIIMGDILAYRQARAAHRASSEIAAAIQTKAAEVDNIEEISIDEVVASVKRPAAVSKEQLKRLAEQGKQQVLIDDEYFKDKLGPLIVDYLQPLPRNAKRVLNRFRVNLLIAHRRKLFTDEPKVTMEQIGKWLVLAERWPQLSRALGADPERMAALETEASAPVTPPPAPPPGEKRRAPPLDPFMASIKGLAPFYVGDEDLRRLLNSPPSLGKVLSRLVHYGEPTAPVTS